MKKEYIEQVIWYISQTLSHPIDNGILVSLYYKIGFFLCNHYVPYSGLQKLEGELRKNYGMVIGFTNRNLIWMMQFYQAYPQFHYLKWIPWHQHINLLRTKKRRYKKLILVKIGMKKKVEYKKKCISFIRTNYMLTEIQMLQQKL